MASEKFAAFDSMVAQEVPVVPKGGFKYLYTWLDEKKNNDWRADGYRWRQMGSWRAMKCADGAISKVWFYVRTVCYVVSKIVLTNSKTVICHRTS